MFVDFSKEKVRRSRLIMPVNNEKFLEKAFLRNADAIVLDLEDSVPESQKKIARSFLKGAIPLVIKGGSEVLIRINNTSTLLIDDLKASVLPGVDGVYVPKVESAKQIEEIDKIISHLETEKSIKKGEVKIGILIETVKGLSNIKEIVQASERIDSLTLGLEDFSVDSGIAISEETYAAMLGPKMKIVLSARAFGKIPMGLMGSLTGFNDLENFKKNAELAYQHGFLGASCIHPINVEILNQCFSPSTEEIDYSKKVVALIDESRRIGKGATVLDGKMIDTAHYEKAKQILYRQSKIEEFELKKKKAREASE
ncbi:HpcH/HpaI aldolase/citrate lyase family protein [Planococcus faecalis]|uniref:HpcH/HpaI aldolase/citrate lyase family protein n=1 Tax=Planococcus faecalis TaxID=1598147 RepID=UPI0008DA6761|nr:CoA ester lyase [Planococcus faecalis]OHX51630.1 hypothetical protein BB777_15765 [Planococcus faecalis]